jgi:EAL domain-containing protein (putative c-di-GMP-specific phosphodiesterase class I)
VAEKIREALARPYRLFDQEYQSTPSIGVALYHGNGESVEDLLRQADLAMYQVKNSGRNAICFFDASMQDAPGSREALLDDLDHALERGELHLYYQPQVDGERRTVGAEALLRWEHPQRGLVMPDDFIPVAEKSALILDIDRWVLSEACARLLRWAEDERTRRLTLAVNISARFFAQPGFIGEMAALLASHRIVPGLLIVEVNERMVMENQPGALGKMQELKALGVTLSIDDFGSGYSSLTYLKQMPLDQLKICRSFVQGIESNDNDTQLVQSILDLGQRFGLSVLAEGVETEAQFAFLKRHDCLSCQGFLFGQAVPPEQFEGTLGA